jgi:RNA 3'-terminal phosphate cyclase (ATP)
MLTIDGSQQSGSGTIVRYAVALAALSCQSVRITNVRQSRSKPGLRPQHVLSVLACADLCGGAAEGLDVGSREFSFTPGARIAGGSFEWNIGTAGSTTMLALSVLPIACFAEAPVRARIEGGLFQDFAPSPHHLQHVLAPLLQRMGAEVDVAVVRPGYVPGGAGILELTVRPSGRLTGITLAEPGRVKHVRGIALASRLAERRVNVRMAAACQSLLEAAGLVCDIDRVDDNEARHPGASLTIWAESTSGCRFGADRAGAYGRTSEAIGRFVARAFLADVGSGATVDRHLADQLVLFAALAHGSSRYLVPQITDHVLSNVWMVRQFGATVSVADTAIEIEGTSLTARPSARGDG